MIGTEGADRLIVGIVEGLYDPNDLPVGSVAEICAGLALGQKNADIAARNALPLSPLNARISAHFPRDSGMRGPPAGRSGCGVGAHAGFAVALDHTFTLHLEQRQR